MKIRITQSGYEAFCGLLGDVKFDNGVSVGDANEQQIAYVAAMFTTETFEENVEGEVVDQDEAAKLAEAERLAAEAERERAEADAAEAAAQAAAQEVAAVQGKKVAK